MIVHLWGFRISQWKFWAQTVIANISPDNSTITSAFGMFTYETFYSLSMARNGNGWVEHTLFGRHNTLIFCNWTGIDILLQCSQSCLMILWIESIVWVTQCRISVIFKPRYEDLSCIPTCSPLAYSHRHYLFNNRLSQYEFILSFASSSSL